MKFDLFINFGGNCREAMDFYATVFKSEVKDLMTYAETPQGAGEVADADRDKIMYGYVPIFGSNVMFMDMPEGMPVVQGNQITPTLSGADKAEIERIFAALAAEGTVDVPLGQSFFSALYGMVTDKFGIIWHLLWNEDSGA